MEYNTKKKIIPIEVYTDGSSKKLGQKSFGAWAFVIVKDNGVGFSDVVESDDEDKNATTQDDVEDLSFKQVSKGIGLTSMQYRADQINASFKIKKNKPCGTCVELKVYPH
jgi:nitrate/nitrite-specific signal transduction histidine kinase